MEYEDGYGVMGTWERVDVVLPGNGLTCSDSILAFLISSRLFEIGILSSPSLFLSASILD